MSFIYYRIYNAYIIKCLIVLHMMSKHCSIKCVETRKRFTYNLERAILLLKSRNPYNFLINFSNKYT